MSELSRQEFEERLVNLVSGNQEIREKLVNDPKAMIEKLLATELPEDVSIVVHEEDANTLHFVLPPNNDELSSAELSSVSGGGPCWDNAPPSSPKY